MQQMPKRKEPLGIKTKCVVCGDKFEFVSASFVPICNDCRKQHNKTKVNKHGGREWERKIV